MTQTTETRTHVDLYPSRKDSVPRLLDREDPVVRGGPGDGPLDPETLETFEKKGFLVFPGMFDRDELEPFFAEIDRVRRDPAMKKRADTVVEPESEQIRSVFAVHENNEILSRLCRHRRVVEIARQILGGDIYIHQSRVNFKPGFRGKPFYWHSDFETWHVEDGMPRMRAVSCSIGLTTNTPNNGPLMLVPGSHRKFLACVGETPEKHYEESLEKQELGVPDDESLAWMVEEGGIETALGPIGTVLLFDCNVMHGSNSNITPMPRSNCFTVFNSVENTLVEPFCGLAPRPQFIGNREDTSPIEPA